MHTDLGRWHDLLHESFLPCPCPCCPCSCPLWRWPPPQRPTPIPSISQGHSKPWRPQATQLLLTLLMSTLAAADDPAHAHRPSPHAQLLMTLPVSIPVGGFLAFTCVSAEVTCAFFTVLTPLLWPLKFLCKWWHATCTISQVGPWASLCGPVHVWWGRGGAVPQVQLTHQGESTWRMHGWWHATCTISQGGSVGQRPAGMWLLQRHGLPVIRVHASRA